MADSIPIWIGYDPREAVAYHVCCESILSRASVPVSFHPLALNTLKGLYKERHGDGSNDFIYSRFLVPYLSGFKGHALYMDSDMIVKDDIAELWGLRDSLKGVQVVQHDYQTKHPQKYFGATNPNYPRKNWSSLILWNCGYMPNRILTPEYVAEAGGAHLHRFAWLSDDRIGGLPTTFNWLVEEYDHNPEAKILHYTIGTPCIEGFEKSEHAIDWYTELAGALNVAGQKPSWLTSYADLA